VSLAARDLSERTASTPQSSNAVVAAWVGVVIAVSALSLLVPATLTFDAWGWMVWGRELRHLTLDTSAGPSWKPLPVAVTAPLSLLGDHAAAGWLLVARASGLLVLAAAWRLATRCAGPVAGAVAVVLIVLSPDGESRFLRLLAEGHTAPLEAALFLWSIERILARRFGAALALGVGLSLLRPEAWPFLAVYGWWVWSRRPALRPWLAASALTIPAAWFGADWWGSGSPWHGADGAQVVNRYGVVRRTDAALARTRRMVVAPAWVGAAAAVVLAARRRHTDQLFYAAAAAAWALVVVAMSAVFGYAALSRFLLPSAALVCVLAGIGAVTVVRLARVRAVRIALALAMVVVTLPFALPRITVINDVAHDTRTRAELERDLDELIRRAGGPTAMQSCGSIVIDNAELAGAAWPALAWKLDRPMSQVGTSSVTGPAVAIVRVLGDSTLRIPAWLPGSWTEIARSRRWAALAVGCLPGG
jgi:hypothetical protein